MTITTSYQFALMLSREDGSLAGRVPVDADWEPAAEWARFQAVRRGLLAPSALVAAEVLPVWSATPGAPFMRAFAVRLALPERPAAPFAEEFPTRYFKDLAVGASSRLVAEGSLREGEVFRYRPVAFRGSSGPPPDRSRIAAEESIPPLPLGSSSLAEFLAESVADGDTEPETLPAFVPRRVLDEARTITRGAGECETGGILIGHLHRDAERGELFAEVTAQLPARHVVAARTKLTFTPATWSEVRAAMDLRGGREVMLGWWHSHPSRLWCAGCPPENQRVCQLGGEFFSADDRQLHRTVFPRAYSLALVVNDTPTGLSFSMYGWKQGMVERRGFHVVVAAPGAPPPAGSLAQGG